MGTHCFSICSNTTQPAPAKVTGTMTSLISVDLVIHALSTQDMFSLIILFIKGKYVWKEILMGRMQNLA